MSILIWNLDDYFSLIKDRILFISGGREEDGGGMCEVAILVYKQNPYGKNVTLFFNEGFPYGRKIYKI